MRRAIVAALGATAFGAEAAADESAPDDALNFTIAYTADVIGVVDGGLAERGRFLDNLNVVADLDLERLWGWRGVTAHADILNNAGGVPNDDAGTLQGVDNIEVASHRARLFEAWVEKAFGAGSVRVGLYDLNSEFYANDAAGLLMAPAFGIGSEIAATGPNGPSIFPSTALAVRLAAAFGDNYFARAAVLNADAGVLGDPDGVDVSFDEGALLIAEGGVEGAHKLAVGVWRYTRHQDDIRDLTLAGDPEQRIANGAYLLIEQPINETDGPRETRAFVRAGVSDGDTTPFGGGWQAGLHVARMFEGRPDSAFSIGVNQGLLSDGYRQNAIDLGADMAKSEFQIEVTYSDAILPGVTVQPDLQWIQRPGGDRGVPDAFVAGLRLSIEI